MENSKNQFKELRKNRYAKTLITIGSFLVITTALLSCFIFGITYGTAFIGVTGFIIILFGIFDKLTESHSFRVKTKGLRKFLLVALIIIATSFILIESFVILNVNSYQNEKTDYVLVLGAGLRGKEPSLTLSKRLITSVEYLKAHPEVKVIVSGGQGEGELITEAEAMKRYLIKNGINKERIIKEEKSTSTKENIIFSKNILDKIEGDKNHKIMLITSDFHMFRAKYLARKNGLTVYGKSAKTPTFVFINYMIREYFAVIKSFIFD